MFESIYIIRAHFCGSYNVLSRATSSKQLRNRRDDSKRYEGSPIIDGLAIIYCGKPAQLNFTSLSLSTILPLKISS